MKSKARILIIGKDEPLLRTRQLVLGTFFQAETAGRVPHAVDKLKDHKYDLVVLCYSLLDEECQKIVDMIASHEPRPQVLTLSTAGRPSAPAGIHEELSAEDGPYALVKKCAQMLGVELKGIGRAPQRLVRQTPAFRF